MSEKTAIKRITAILLAMIMVLSVPCYVSAEDAEQETGGYADELVVEEASEADVSESSETELSEPEPEEPEEPEPEEPEEPEPEEPGNLANIRVSAAGEDGRITVAWSAVSGAKYYIVRLDESTAGTKVVVSGSTVLKTVLAASAGTVHSITVDAYGSQPTAEDVLIGRGVIKNVRSFSRNRITKKNASAAKLDFNLRKLLGEPRGGYAVVQGACTDGKYAYSLMVSSSTQKGRVLKTVVGTDTVAARSDIINTCHGNGMTINTKERKLVVVGRESRRNQLVVINADNLSDVSYVKVNYGYSGYWDSTAGNGLSCISYIPEYDCYVALQRKTHELLILDKRFRVIGQAGTKITANYPGTYQAMDADARYVYLVLSYYSSRQPYNIVLVLDWNSENLLDVVNGNRSHISKRWMCNNDGSGRPDTVIRINTSHEAENIYHIDQGNGTAHFYLSEYYNSPKYRTVTKYKTVKVRTRRVKKRVRVKWKKVKVNGKWKWKYKYKWKKVWKYKKIKKKYKVREVKYFNRNNYVYDLGSF